MKRDVTFILDNGKTLGANRELLGNRSPFFKTMFHSEMTEATSKTIKIPEIDEHAFRAVLEWVSTTDYNTVLRTVHGDGYMTSSFFKRRKISNRYTEVTEDNPKMPAVCTNLLLNVLMASDRFDMPMLKSLCVDDLKDSLHSSCVCDILKIASLLQHEELKTVCINYILKHRQKIDALNTLTKDLLIEIMQTD